MQSMPQAMRHSWFFRNGRPWIFLALLLGGCQTQPSLAKQAPLLEINRIEPGIKLDIRYATRNNFTGRVLYSTARALLLPEPALALARAHGKLKPTGYGLLIYDAYRPWSVTRDLWNSASAPDRANGYVANPTEGSKHNRGCAVDVGLYALDTGKEVEMPSAFDDFSVRAHADWTGGSEESRHNRDRLRQAMEAEGFRVLPNEWWHFNFRDCDQQPLLDIPFESVR